MRVGEANDLARPKSPSFNIPCRSTNKLLGFKSYAEKWWRQLLWAIFHITLWRIHSWWRYSRPWSVISMYAFMCPGARTTVLSLIICSRSVSMKSKTRETFDRWPNTSSKPMIWGCVSSCSSLISRNAVLFIPSLASSLDPSLICHTTNNVRLLSWINLVQNTFLTATILSSLCVSFALYTVAN